MQTLGAALAPVQGAVGGGSWREGVDGVGEDGGEDGQDEDDGKMHCDWVFCVC